MFETIVALATPPMKSALAIIRVSGDDCFAIISKCFSKDITNIQERTLLVGYIANKITNQKIDEVVLAIYKGPKSFTGEDLVEIICHGSSLISQQILDILIENGARMATNGEYSSRAFIHQKVDLVQAEAINDIINATTKEAKDISMFSLQGKTSTLLNPVKTRLADIISLIEVNIDYPEYEDIEQANKQQIITICDEINQMIEKLIDDGEKAKIIKDGLKVAIVGKPNVGKSSLLNALMGEEKAIVTDIAGTTRDIVEGDINLNGIVLHLLDTAGIRESNDVVENIGVNKAKETLEKADLVLVVLDGANNLTNEDDEILKMTEKLNRIIIYNKADKISSKNKDNIYISALNKDINPLVKEIYKNIGLEEQTFKQPALANTRQIGLLKQARSSLNKAKEDASNDLPVELLSVNLMDAYNAILDILGERNKADLSKEIFSRFCVGK
ncbi:MAG: tRNA uridine-5-carboxymethylaminomethyl(34) synthesis GTPase MnmE [Bacilli bacterium]|nr:tRNA uridine-5-carboxymethylaminomethyl(34) synthesis GTPase MnmE [Bacilli bacterium]